MKKLPITAAIILVIGLVAAALYASAPNLFKGALNSSGQISSSYKDTRLARVTRGLTELERRVKLIEQDAVKNNFLKKKFDAVRGRIGHYRYKLTKLSPGEAPAIVHLFDAEALFDQVASIERIIAWPKTAKKLETTISTLLSKYAKNKSFDYSSIQLLGIRSRAENLQKDYSENMEEFAREADSLRRDIVRLTMSLQTVPGIQALSEYTYELPFDAEYQAHGRPGDSNPGVTPPPPPPRNVKHIVFCGIRWTERTHVPSREDLENTLAQINAYYAENSFGNVRITADYIFPDRVVRGTLPKSYMDEMYRALELCGDSVDFTDTDAFVVLPSGFGSRGGPHVFETPEGETVGVGFAWFGYSNWSDIENQSNEFIDWIGAHEFGHALFGLAHANSWECYDHAFSREVCELIEYGNPFDVMGSAGFTVHFNAFYKYLAGKWLALRHIFEDGDYILTDIERRGAGDKILRIPYRENPLCIEYRLPVGFDGVYSSWTFENRIREGRLTGPPPDPAQPHKGIPKDGCLFVSTCSFTDANGEVNYLVDTKPDTEEDSFWDALDACVWPGERFENRDLGITLSFERLLQEFSANVHVDLNEGRLDRPQLQLRVYDNADSCRFEHGAFVEIANVSEIPRDEQFIVEVSGFDERGRETLIERREIESLRAGGFLQWEYDDISRFQRIRITSEGASPAEIRRDCRQQRPVTP